MNKKRIAKAVILPLILLLCVIYLSDILQMKWKYPCYESVVPEQFYDMEKNSIEVCVLGSSQVVYGISGMELYGEYGISAFSLGLHSSRSRQATHGCRNAEKHRISSC